MDRDRPGGSGEEGGECRRQHLQSYTLSKYGSYILIYKCWMKSLPGRTCAKAFISGLPLDCVGC